MDWRSVGPGGARAVLLLVAGLVLLAIGLFEGGASWALLAGILFLAAGGWAYVASRRRRL